MPTMKQVKGWLPGLYNLTYCLRKAPAKCRGALNVCVVLFFSLIFLSRSPERQDARRQKYFVHIRVKKRTVDKT